MSYNTAHFEDSIVEQVDKKIVMIFECEKLVLDSVVTFLKSTKSYEQTENFSAFIHLLIKIRFNIEAAHRLLPLLKDDYRFKTSINLLYRSCLDDTINIYYLLGYVLTDTATRNVSKDQSSLGNELDILHREFLKSACVIIESEIEGAKYYSKLNEEKYVPVPGNGNWKEEMINANSNLYNADKSAWKNNKEIRVTSHPMFEQQFPDSNNKIPDSSKITFIEKKGFERAFQLTQLFRYFSQYQHFSPKMHAFLLTTPEHDLEYYHQMLVEILCVMSECNQIIVTEDRDANRASIEAHILRVFELYNAVGQK